MSQWSTNQASVQATKNAASGNNSALDATSPIIVYPNKDGSTGGSNPNYNAPGSNSGDLYGGNPINLTLNTGSQGSAQGLTNIAGSLSQGFEGLFDMLQKTTDKNNEWSAKQAQKQMDFQERMNKIAQEFNAGEAAKNRDWQQMMSNTAHQREIADLQAAGLNPILSASGGNGAAVTSGATAAGINAPSGAKADADQSMNGALASIYGSIINAQQSMYNANLSAQTNLKMAQMQQETNRYASELAAEASRFAASTNAGASNYAANLNYQNQQEQRQWNADHPSNAYQTVASVLGGNNGVSSAKQAGKSWLSNIASWFLDRDRKHYVP